MRVIDSECGQVVLWQRQQLLTHCVSLCFFCSASVGLFSFLFSAQGSWLGFIWNSILIVMLLWFVKSIIESSVQERLADRDAATLEAWAAEHGERVGVTTRLMSEKERLQQEAAAAAANNSNKKKQVR